MVTSRIEFDVPENVIEVGVVLAPTFAILRRVLLYGIVAQQPLVTRCTQSEAVNTVILSLVSWPAVGGDDRGVAFVGERGASIVIKRIPTSICSHLIV